jgi:hypothetical protein
MKEFYFINEKNEQVGPISKETLLEKIKDGNTLIWTEELPNWIKLKDYSELASEIELKKQPPPLPKVEQPKTGISFNPSSKSVRRIIIWIGANLIFALLSYSGAEIFNRDREHSTYEFWPFVNFMGQEIDPESYKSSKFEEKSDSPIGGLRMGRMRDYFRGILTDYDWTEFYVYSGIGIFIFIIGNLKEQSKT